MIPYKVIKTDMVYQILETETNQIIYEGTDEKRAKATAKKLNLGGGFNGVTPNFFTKKVDLDKLFGKDSDK